MKEFESQSPRRSPVRSASAECQAAKAPIAMLLVSDLEYGGAQRQVVELANHMDPKRFEIYIASLSSYTPLGQRLQFRERRLKVISKHGKYDLTVALRLAMLMRRLQVSVLHTFLFDADFYGRIAGLLARTPVVIGSERNSDYIPKRRHVLAYFVTRKLCNIVIANSKHGAEFHCKRFGVKPKLLTVIHNGVDLSRFSRVDSTPLRRELKLKSNSKVVGVFASFKPQKNHQFMIRCAPKILSRFPNVVFIFVGDELFRGMENSSLYKRKMVDLVESLGIWNQCRFVGNQVDLSAYYSLCQATVLPSLFEGTPNVALESMACEVPVVATRVSDNEEIIPDGRVGYLVDSGDEAALVERVCRLLGQDELARSLGAQGRAWVHENFSSDRLAERTALAYETALSSQQRARKHK